MPIDAMALTPLKTGPPCTVAAVVDVSAIAMVALADSLVGQEMVGMRITTDLEKTETAATAAEEATITAGSDTTTILVTMTRVNGDTKKHLTDTVCWVGFYSRFYLMRSSFATLGKNASLLPFQLSNPSPINNHPLSQWPATYSHEHAEHDQRQSRNRLLRRSWHKELPRNARLAR